MNKKQKHSKPTVIGTDKSFNTCKGEGYTILTYPNRYFQLQIIEHLAQCIRTQEEQKKLMLTTNVSIDFDDLWELYLTNKTSIDEMADTDYNVMPDKEDLHTWLHIASNINAYYGLE